MTNDFDHSCTIDSAGVQYLPDRPIIETQSLNMMNCYDTNYEIRSSLA